MKAVIFWVIVVAVFVTGSTAFMTQMPGESVVATNPQLSDEESDVSERLRGHIETLAGEIGQRTSSSEMTSAAVVDYLEKAVRRTGFSVSEETFQARHGQGVNVVGTLAGTRKASEIVLLGANWDSRLNSPGADDNASGCAVLLEVARLLSANPHERTIRIVFFAEGADFLAGDERSGAHFHAQGARKRGDKIVAMLDFDCLGHFPDAAGSQTRWPPFNFVYPDTGNFVFFAGQLSSRNLVGQMVGEFRKTTKFPCQGGVLPSFIPGVKSGDYAPFAAHGWPSAIVTDTASFRSDKVSNGFDTIDRIDYARSARVAVGLEKVVAALAATSGAL